LNGIQNNHKGCQWKDASEEDIDLFFLKMDQVDTEKLTLLKQSLSKCPQIYSFVQGMGKEVGKAFIVMYSFYFF
jgi:hypothetical protein